MHRPEKTGPQHLQALIDQLTRTQQGRPLDETVQKLTDALHAVGQEPPSTSWIDAVARAAIQGHPYIASGTAQLEAAGLQLGSPLDDAPARIEVTPTAPATGPTPAPDGPNTPDEKRAAKEPSRRGRAKTPPTAAIGDRRRALVAAAALALIAALYLYRRRRSRRCPVTTGGHPQGQGDHRG